MSNEVRAEDFVEREFDNDSGELNTKEDVSICLGSDKKNVQKHRKTSKVWNYFDPLPSTGQNDDKLRANCKLCGTTYLAPSAYGTINLKRHIQTCPRRDIHDVIQMLIYEN